MHAFPTCKSETSYKQIMNNTLALVLICIPHVDLSCKHTDSAMHFDTNSVALTKQFPIKLNSTTVKHSACRYIIPSFSQQIFSEQG